MVAAGNELFQKLLMPAVFASYIDASVISSDGERQFPKVAEIKQVPTAAAEAR